MSRFTESGDRVDQANIQQKQIHREKKWRRLRVLAFTLTLKITLLQLNSNPLNSLTLTQTQIITFPSLYTYIRTGPYYLRHSLSSVSLFPRLLFLQSEIFVFTSSPGFRILYLQWRTSIFQFTALHEFCGIVSPRHLISTANRGF